MKGEIAMYCNCFFCEEDRFAVNRILGLEAESSVIYEDENIFVTPDIAPVMVGHFLIVAQQHINSFGNADEKTYSSMQAAKKFLIEKIYHSHNVLFWEHGAVISHSAGSCIDHAHIHAIPLPVSLDIDNYLDSMDFLNATKHSLEYDSLRETASNEQPYISYEYGSGEGYYRCVDWMPSQFFRLMLSKYQVQEYNWKLRIKDKESINLFEQTLAMARS